VGAAELVREFFRRLDARDVDGVVDLFTEDCTFSIALQRRDLEGKDELRAFLNEHLASWYDRCETPTTVLVEGNAAAAEVRVEGVVRGGKPVAIDNVNVWEFARGGIRRLRIYTDTAPYLAALAE
jgi:ketosteroid isomerase-like protein